MKERESQSLNIYVRIHEFPPRKERERDSADPPSKIGNHTREIYIIIIINKPVRAVASSET